MITIRVIITLSLVSSEGDDPVFNAGSRDDAHPQTISSVDVSLGSCAEHVLNERDRLLNRKWLLRHILLILVTNLKKSHKMLEHLNQVKIYNLFPNS